MKFANLAYIHGGPTQITLPPARADSEPIALGHSFYKRSPLRVFDQRGFLVATLQPGTVARFLAVPAWWCAWLPRQWRNWQTVWEQQP